MPYTIRRATAAAWAAWLETITLEDEETGDPIPPTPADLLNRNVVVAHEDAVEVLYHCGELDPERAAALPGEVLTAGTLSRRHIDLPPEAKTKVYRAEVYRGRGYDLRAAAEAATGKGLGARIPANGSKSGRPQDPAGALEVLEEARRRAHPEDPETESTADRLLLPMVEVEDSDVVAADAIPSIRWAGERE